MAKQSGLGWTTFSVDDSAGTARDLRGDTTNLDFATPREVQDVTSLEKNAMERLLLLADFSCSTNGVFNPSANQSHEILSDAATTSAQRTVSIGIAGATLDNECLLTDYKLTRDASGAFTYEAPFILADGTVPTWA